MRTFRDIIARATALVPSPLQANRYQDPAYGRRRKERWTAHDARVADWNAEAVPAGRAKYGEYRRFDWRQPGSAQREAGFDDDRAALAFDRINAYQYPRESAQTRAGELARGDLSLEDAEAAMGDWQRRKFNSGSLDKQQFFNDLGIGPDSTVAQKAAAWDAYGRYQQYKNQLPKRSLTRSLPGQLAMLALGQTFGAPLLAGGFKAAGASRFLPAAQAAGGLKTLRDFARVV